jgi:transglutaminase-like putative cysteine protease
MNRRDFLQHAGAASAGLVLARPMLTKPADDWRRFEVMTRVEVVKPVGTTRVWVPAALVQQTPYQQTLANTFDAPGGKARLVERKDDALGLVAAEFPAGVPPVVTVTSRVATRNFAVDVGAENYAVEKGAQRAAPLPRNLKHFLRPTRLLPTGGIVKEKADEITRGASSDVDKARAIYDWIVDHTFRKPTTRGCGLGDIRFMLATGDLGGKCADLNALFVGLARASGLPARDVYGIRVAPSALGYRSLGASSDHVTKSQHCRAEVYLQDSGWVPVDPADVRKVVLEEPPGNRPLDDAMVTAARARLFGSWEMNWMAYNFAHDVVLPGSLGEPLPFLMYPQAETAEGRIDSLDPDAFKYEIIAREIE